VTGTAGVVGKEVDVVGRVHSDRLDMVIRRDDPRVSEGGEVESEVGQRDYGSDEEALGGGEEEPGGSEEDIDPSRHEDEVEDEYQGVRFVDDVVTASEEEGLEGSTAEATVEGGEEGREGVAEETVGCANGGFAACSSEHG
jgi:hypothetical protein